MKKLLAILLSVLMLCSVIPFAAVAVSAADDSAALSALKGDISFAASGKNVSISLNAAEINYTTAEKGDVVNFSSSAASIIAHADAPVTLKSIDDNQSWTLNDSAADALTFRRVAYHAVGDVAVSAADSNASVLSASLDDGECLVLGKDGSGRTDIVVVNGVTISSAAKAGGSTSSTISAEDDVLVLSVGDKGGNVTVNGDSAQLAAGASATIVSDWFDAAITAVSALAPNGKWITGRRAVSVGDQIWDLSNSRERVTLTADSEDGSSIAKVNFDRGYVAINPVNSTNVVADTEININDKATWRISGTADDIDDFAVFDANGNVRLTIDDSANSKALATLTSGKNVNFRAGYTGDLLTVSKGAKIYLRHDGLVAANSLAAGSNWFVHAPAARLGTKDRCVMLRADEATGIRAVVTADSQDGSILNNIILVAGNATLSYSNDEDLNSLTVSNATKTISATDNRVIYLQLLAMLPSTPAKNK